MRDEKRLLAEDDSRYEDSIYSISTLSSTSTASKGLAEDDRLRADFYSLQNMGWLKYAKDPAALNEKYQALLALNPLLASIGFESGALLNVISAVAANAARSECRRTEFKERNVARREKEMQKLALERQRMFGGSKKSKRENPNENSEQAVRR